MAPHSTILLSGQTDAQHEITMLWLSQIWNSKIPFYGSRCSIKTIPHTSSYGRTMGCVLCVHYNDVIMGAMASQITSLTIVYSTVCSGADQRQHQSSVSSLTFVRGIHRGPVNSTHKGPATRKMFPFDDVIMIWTCYYRTEPYTLQ